MKVISPLNGGGQEVILTLIQGECNFILRPTLLILDPPPPPDNYCTVPKQVIGISGVKPIVHELHMKGRGHMIKIL